MLVKSGRLQPITGVWRGMGVRRWSFGRPLTTDKVPNGSNIKVLSDGRVTKIYLR